jgi:hypothetical protein
MSLDVYLRLQAMAQGRAAPAASVRHRHLSAKPFVVVGYHLAGEPSAPVALYYGAGRGRPRLLTIAEPRDRDQRFAALGRFARDLSLYLGRFTQTEPVVRTTGKPGLDALEVDHCCLDAPQLVVPNEATARWLTDLLGRYLRRLPPPSPAVAAGPDAGTPLPATGPNSPAGPLPDAQDAEPSEADPALRTAGAHLSWFAQRRQLPGSSSVLTGTDLLSMHWRTGQLPTEDGHLGRALAWVDPPSWTLDAGDVQAAARAAELRPPAGPASDPGWDADVLHPALDLARQGDSRSLKAVAQQALAQSWQDTWRAFDLVTLLPAGEHTTQRWESDRWSWTRHRERVAGGTAAFAARLSDVPAFRFLHELETRTVALERQMALDDPLVMARYVAEGQACAGVVVKRDPEHVQVSPAGRTVLRPLLWVRPATPFNRPAGTQLWLGKLGVTVRSADGDAIELMVTSGAVTRPKLSLLPETEASVVLAPFGPEQRFPDNLPEELPWPTRPADIYSHQEQLDA